ncbi:MAG: TfoX family protein [Betaproteobacteria bacterium]|nr:TfoX family protein [Betaproteobacteria bacterium]
MAIADAFVAHCLELLSALGPARARRMFGGHGLYVDQRFVALISNDMLYLKVDAAARPMFEAAGCRHFRYTSAGVSRTVLAWWSAPEDAMESPVQMLTWARLAVASALRAAIAQGPTPSATLQAARRGRPKACRLT